MVFFVICLFECFFLFPFGVRQREDVFVSLKRATWKIELTLFISFNFTIFQPRRQPTTLVSARGPTAGTPSGNLCC